MIDNLYFGENEVQADLSIIRFISPCKCDTSLQSLVEVEIINNGNIPFNNTSINYQFNNNIVTEVITQTVYAGDTMIFTFGQGITFDTATMEHIVVWLEHTQDTNTFDNHKIYYNTNTYSVIDTFPQPIIFSQVVSDPSGLDDLYTKIETPCIDLSNTEQPILSYDAYSPEEAFQLYNSKLILAYSIDGGNSFYRKDTLFKNSSEFTLHMIDDISDLAGESKLVLRFEKFRQCANCQYYDFNLNNVLIKDNPKNIRLNSFNAGTCHAVGIYPLVAEVENTGFYDAQNVEFYFKARKDNIYAYDTTIVPLIEAGSKLTVSSDLIDSSMIAWYVRTELTANWNEDMDNEDNFIGPEYRYRLLDKVSTYPSTLFVPNDKYGGSGWRINNLESLSLTTPGLHPNEVTWGNFPDYTIESPCFDFSGLNHPELIVRFDLLKHDYNPYQSEGAIWMESSVDDGMNWNTIGEVGEGYNWYETNNFNHKSTGANQAAWLTECNDKIARIMLNDLAGESSVKFRFKAGYTSSWIQMKLKIPRFTIRDTTGQQEQLIAVNEGWNLISTYINPNYLPFEFHLDDYADNIILCKDENGLAYWPQYNLNQIDSFTNGKAYMIKMAAAQEITLSGQQLQPELNTLAIPQGWSYLGYLRTTPQETDVVFGQNTADITIVKQINGTVYWPHYGVNQMPYMYPGIGYQIKASGAFVLSYAANDTSSNKSTYLKSSVVDKIKSTGENMTLLFTKQALIDYPEIKHIRAFNSESMLVGEGNLEDGQIAMAIWGNDASRKTKDGLNANEQFTLFAIMRDKQEFQLNVDHWLSGSQQYGKDKLAVADAISPFDEINEFHLYPIYPNPYKANSTVRFYLPEPDEMHVEVFNLNGQVLSAVNIGNLNAGDHNFPLQLTALPAGTYYLRVSGEKYQAGKKLIVIK